jgi:hypothetical protein
LRQGQFRPAVAPGQAEAKQLRLVHGGHDVRRQSPVGLYPGTGGA